MAAGAWVRPLVKRRTSRSGAMMPAGTSAAFAAGMDASVGSTRNVARPSTSECMRSIPRSAWSDRFRPSNAKGRVTTPTVRAPISWPSSATIGAPPVPVPPPSPAVTKTMSAPLSASFSSSRLSCAAANPTAGSAPAPSPRVTSAPIWIFRSASAIRRACASVLTAMKSTPATPASTIRLTAFVPPPPTPTTLITAR